MTTTSGSPEVTPNPAIHNLPTNTGPNVLAIAKQLEASAEYIIEGILGQVLIAFGGVTIFGVKPFATLTVLGTSIVNTANSAYAQSVTAQSTASTANTNANTALGNFTSLFAGIPGVSTIAGFLSFLIPTSSTSGLFAPLINLVTGGTTNPLSSLSTSLLGTASTASTANTNATSALGNFTSLFAGIPGVSSISTLLSWLIPSTSISGIFAPLINGILGGTTNPLSSLLSNLLGTASTASTASTNSTTNGSNITSLVSNLFGGGSILSSVQASAVPTLADAKLPGLGTLIDDLFGGLTGSSSTGTSQANVGTATASQAETVGGQGALIAQIQAALGAGTPDSDDFERTSLGSNWTFLSSSGSGSDDGHNFHFSGTGSADFVMLKNNLAGTTDHITSTVVLNNAIPNYPFFTPVPYGGYQRVWVRCTAFTTYATRSGVYFEINANGYTAAWRLVNVVSGAETALTSGSCGVPSAGAIISLESGASATPRRYLGTLNGTTVCDFTDSGSTTTIGSSNRHRGFGGKGNSGIGASVGTPDIRQWTAAG